AMQRDGSTLYILLRFFVTYKNIVSGICYFYPWGVPVFGFCQRREEDLQGRSVSSPCKSYPTSHTED
ncbi:MAG: hypothetical protein ACQES0_08100, partial [Bacteroidota bacterium]